MIALHAEPASTNALKALFQKVISTKSTLQLVLTAELVQMFALPVLSLQKSNHQHLRNKMSRRFSAGSFFIHPYPKVNDITQR